MSLFDAVKRGDVDAAAKALRAGADRNELGEGGRTPLIEAAQQGRADLVALLLQAGADPSLSDEMQETALLKAAAHGHRDVCALLFPCAGDDEKAQAHAFLSAVGREGGPAEPADGRTLERRVAEWLARAAELLGHDEPKKRIERLERAERRKK